MTETETETGTDAGTEAQTGSTVAARTPLDEIRDLWRLRARRVGAAIAGFGLAFDLAIRNGSATTAATVAALTIVGVTWAAIPVRRRAARLALGAAAAFAIGVTLRSSTWLVPLDLLAVALLVILAALIEMRRADEPLRLVEVALAWIGAVATVPATPLHVAVVAATSAPPPGERTRRRAATALRGVLLAVPVTVLVGALLASADGVFRSFLSVPVDPGDGVLHVLTVAAGACLGVVPLLCARRHATDVSARRVRPDRGDRTGVSEVAVVVGVLTALYTLFAAAQATALVRGDAYVQRTTGLTYAEYARAGYFQLLVVAAITAIVLLVVRATATQEGAGATRVLRVLGASAAALTLLILASAVRRLALYDAALGWTMLRLACVVFAAWMAAVFIGLGVAILRARPGRPDHLAAMLVISAFATLALWNLANPAAVVARHNLDRAARGATLDIAYLDHLGADAAPTIIGSLDELDPTTAAEVRAVVCRDRGHATSGALATNLALRRATDARATCLLVAPDR